MCSWTRSTIWSFVCSLAFVFNASAMEPEKPSKEYLWEQLNRRIAVLKELKSKFASKTRPHMAISSSEQSQSLIQLQSLFGTNKSEDELISLAINYTKKYLHSPEYNAVVRNLLNKQYTDLARKILQNESQHADYFVLYHGQSGALTLINDIMQLIYSWFDISTPSQQTQFLRLIATHLQKYSIEEFLNQLKDKMHDIEYIVSFGVMPLFDYIPAVRDNLLSCNLALFGNAGDPSESSWHYFARGQSINIPELDKKLLEFFKLFEFDTKFIKTILQVYALYMQAIHTTITMSDGTRIEIKPGLLYQIFIHPSVIDDVAYLAEPGGTFLTFNPFSLMVLDLYPETKNVTPITLQFLQDTLFDAKRDRISISKYLSLLKTEPNKIPSVIINHAQARLYLDYSILLNPEKVKIFTYRTPNFNQDRADQAYGVYQKRLAIIIEKMIKEWLLNETRSTGKLTRLEHLYNLLKERKE